MNGSGLVFRALVFGPAKRHPLRVILPVIGVAIGVAAVAAIHHANRSVTESFREAASSLAGRSDFTVFGVGGVPIQALASLSFLWESGSLAPAVTGSVVMDDGSGEIVELLGIDPGGDGLVRDIRLVDPSSGPFLAQLLASPSVFVPRPLARRHRLAVGQRIHLIAGGVPRTLTVGGLLELGGVARASGGDLLVTDLFTAQRILGKEGSVDRVDIVLDPGVSREDVERAVRRRLSPGLRLEDPGRSALAADRMVRAFRFNLNALGSLTLLVGVFLIANAVSIAVLRRRPEIATLRALGASRGLLFCVFLAEGILIGAAGTLLGEVGGVFLARAALRTVSQTVSDVYLPAAKIHSVGYPAAAGLAATVGMLAAIVATLLPAAEATRVSPSPAMRPGSVESVRRRRLKGRAAAALLTLTLAAVASRAGPVDEFPFFGFAAALLVVAALTILSPLLVCAAALLSRRPLARLFGAAGRLASGFFGGALARNSIAVTALAMALGMTLAMIVTVASIRQTVRVWVESTLRSDLWIKAAAGKHSGLVGDLPEDIIPFLSGVAGVAAVDPFRAQEAEAQGLPYTLASGDFQVVARVGGLPMLDGQDSREAAQEARKRGEVLISEPYARRFGVSRGDLVAIATPTGSRRLRVQGVYRDYSNDRGTVVLDRTLYLSLFGDRRVTSLAVLAAPATDITQLRRSILAASRGRYALSVSTNRELRREALQIFDRTFAVTRALEAIAVGVAILGIANALVASAVERRRSFGLLRAIGASAAQIRGAVLLEATLTGAASVLASFAAALAFAYLLLAVINPQSFGWTVAVSVPVARLAGAAALVLGASILAGIFPGRLAASVDPASALAEE